MIIEGTIYYIIRIVLPKIEKKMNIEVIGINAGLVWNALNGNGKLTLKKIKKATKFKEKEIYAALGWLARQAKVTFDEAAEEIVIELIG